MPNMLETGMQYLVTQLQANASVVVTYTRGAQEVTVFATLGRQLLQLSDEIGGIRMEWTDLDVIIAAADLHFEDLVTITPTRGDLIAIPRGLETHTYEVLPYGGEPCWRWSDQYQTLLRIHTKHIDTETLF